MLESFSQDTKNEISTAKSKMKCCHLSELYGMIFGAAYFSFDGIILNTENPSVMIRFTKLIKEHISIKGKNDISFAQIDSKEILSELFEKLGFPAEPDTDKIYSELFKCQFCKWSFVRGMFLSCGTVNSPSAGYHLEFLLRSKNAAVSFMGLLTELGLSPRTVPRGGHCFGVYFKDIDSITDILGYIGANKAVFKISETVMYKNFRNEINRRANCDYANVGKTVAASNQQTKAIEKIIESGRSGDLPDELKETLDLRMAFPSATLAELAEKHTPPITKSGVNHRLKRLIAIAQKC